MRLVSISVVCCASISAVWRVSDGSLSQSLANQRSLAAPQFGAFVPVVLLSVIVPQGVLLTAYCAAISPCTIANAGNRSLCHNHCTTASVGDRSLCCNQCKIFSSGQDAWNHSVYFSAVKFARCQSGMGHCLTDGPLTGSVFVDNSNIDDTQHFLVPLGLDAKVAQSGSGWCSKLQVTEGHDMQN